MWIYHSFIYSVVFGWTIPNTCANFIYYCWNANEYSHFGRQWQFLAKLNTVLHKSYQSCFSLPKWVKLAAKSLQSCPTLCDPIDGSPPGSAIPGILQARTLEWVAIALSNAWKWKVKVKLLSRARLLATPWTAAYQAPPSMGFSRQEYWSGLPLPSLMSMQKTVQKIFLVVLFIIAKNSIHNC